ncbi:MAG: MBOAT family protein [Bacteroidetes bacterium]|uniref:MBOAT family protein n=1 Tax=Candidatus Gallipaludibacter merdavium TaxID=2840839 RepID=A0A9D9N3D0_9BACT|nr:MBOAT family protein [Candidatus Gallipaludibacter merdavium]
MELSTLLNFIKDVFAFDENSPLLFTQFYFWAFFALVFAVFSLIKSKRLLRNSFLLFVSLFFYYKTSGFFVLILMFVTCSDFLIAQRIDKASSAVKKKAWLICSIVIDLFLLCYFKYAYFFTDVINNMFGWELHVFDAFAWIGNALTGTERFRVDQIILPVGISFYTFQVISYTVDVYKGSIRPVRNLLDFGFYVSFFPQLVAGPIVRASEFIPQLYKPYHLGRRQFGIAVFWILNGLAKKIILSDYIAVNFIDRVFENPLLFSGFENLMALFGYSLQVYADFSGYTDIATGVAMLMGFYLPQNFNSPYKAPNASNFWKRWHISLSRWLQTYLYIPLGGNRNASFGTYFWIILIALIALILSGSLYAALTVIGVAIILGLVAWFKPEKRIKIITNLNSFITMLLGGIWHGASWNFMIWGGLNGVGMIIYKFWRDMKWIWRMVWVGATTLVLGLLCHFTPQPVYNMLFVWVAIICAGSVIRYIYHLTRCQYPFKHLGNAWAVTQTFVFITFTRLFFRSGSNLDPAVANEVAWNTAKNMVNQIGSTWNTSIIPQIIWEYKNVFLLIVLGMIIHWLPVNFKRWYRLNFALLPVPVIALLVVFVVFVVYQFITADLQAFIYFQF